MPLYGDMHIRLIKQIEDGPNFDKSKWSSSMEALDEHIGAARYNIVAKLPTFQEERDRYMCTLALIANTVREHQFARPTARSSQQELFPWAPNSLSNIFFSAAFCALGR